MTLSPSQKEDLEPQVRQVFEALLFIKWSLISVQPPPLLHLMISLCPACHAKVHRTLAVLSEMPPLLLQLWREQHPKGHEQKMLNFSARGPAAQHVSLFESS